MARAAAFKGTVAVLLFLAVAASRGAADDCPDCRDSICPTHEAADNEALAPFLQPNGLPTPEDKIAALNRYSSVCKQHLNMRSINNPRRIAGMLLDEDHRVRMRAAEVLRETQNPHAAAEIVAGRIRVLRINLEKRPDKKSDWPAWDRDLEFYKALALVLGESGILEASPPVVYMLKATSMELLEIAANICSRVRTHEVATAVLDAYARTRSSDPKAGPVGVVLLQAWRAITKTEIRAPKGGSKEDFDRFLAQCRQWLTDNPNGPEGFLK